VNEFGMPNFNTGYGRMASPPPRRQDSGSSKPFLIFLLVLAGLGAGALLAWGLREHSERPRLSQRNVKVEEAYVVVLAKRVDLAHFLTDGKTRLYHLQGRNQANGHTATVAWQEEKCTGILVADDVAPLPDHEVYAMWHLDAEKKPALCGSFTSDPTGTIYNFRCNDPAQSTSGFLISIEPSATAKKPSQIIYETR